MRSLFIGLAAFCYCLVADVGTSAHAQDFVLLDSEQITEKFETSLLVAKELLDARSPPKYLLYRAEATIAKTNGLDGKIAARSRRFWSRPNSPSTITTSPPRPRS